MGCTAGGVIDDKVILLFKNMDITGDDEFIRFSNNGDIAAVCTDEKGDVTQRTSLGLNRYGIFIGGLDHHVNYEPKKDGNSGKITQIYMTVLREAKSFDDAYRLLRILFKHENVDVPDMLVLGGLENNKYVVGLVEFDPMSPERWGIKRVDQGTLVATNYPLTLPRASYPSDDPDSYARLETARVLLESDHSVEGVKKVLRSHENGPGQKSICRHREWIPHDSRARYHKGLYNTAASVIFEIDRFTWKVTGWYIVKKNPCEQTSYDKVDLWNVNS